MRVVHGLKSWKVRAGFLLGVLGVLVVYGFSGVSGKESHPSLLATSSLAISADGSVIVTSDGSNRIALWDGETLNQVKKETGHSGNTYDVAISPDGKYVASSDRGFKLWEVATGKLCLNSKDHSGSVYDINFSPDGKLFANTCCDGTVKLWDVDSGQLMSTLKGHDGDVSSAVFSRDGRVLASAGSDSLIKIWDVSTGELKKTFKFESCSLSCLAFSEDGSTLYVLANEAQAWDLRTGKMKFECKTPGYWTKLFDYSAGSSTVVTCAWKLGSQENILSLWDSKTGEFKQTLGGIVGVNYARFSPDGSLLAVGSLINDYQAPNGERGSTILIWDVAKGKIVTSKKMPKVVVNDVAFTSDSSTIIYDEDGLKKWRIR